MRELIKQSTIIMRELIKQLYFTIINHMRELIKEM